MKTGKLWRTVACFNDTRIRHFRDVLIILMPGDGIQGEIGFLVLHLERAGVDMDSDRLLCQPCLRVKAPTTETNISRPIQVAGKLRRKENAS